MSKPSQFLTKLDFQNLESEIKDRICRILNAADISLKNNLDPKICAGIYLHAVEEYGKYLYIHKILPVNSKYEVDMNGFTDHEIKFRLALKSLPSDCLFLNQGFDPSFQKNAFQVTVPADWWARLDIFNTDIENNKVKIVPNVNPTLLRKAITKFPRTF